MGGTTTDNRETVNIHTRNVFRLASASFGVVAFFYTLLIVNGLLPTSSHYPGHMTALLLCAAMLLYGVLQIAVPAKTKQASMLRFVYFYLVTAAYIVFVSSFSSIFTFLWTASVVSSYFYFGRRGPVISSSLLFVVLAIDSALAGFALAMVASNLTLFFAIVLIGLMIVMAIYGMGVDQRDIEHSHAQASIQRDRMNVLVNNIADAIISIDSGGTVLLYNAAVLNLLDTNADIEGKHLDDVMKLVDLNGKSISIIDSMLASKTLVIRDDLSLKLGGGELVRLEITHSQIRGDYTSSSDTDEHAGYMLILRDITKAKSLEEERDEFISVVSHELRTPITIAEGTISNAQVMMAREDTPQSKVLAAVNEAHDQVLFLARIVNDLSTLSRAERGVADEPEDIDLEEFIADLYSEYQPQAAKKNLQFDLHSTHNPGVVSVSRLYLKELMQNFTTNAIKYTKKGSVSIHVTRKNGAVTLAVKDTGIGISKSDQKRILEKFYRAEDYRTRETNGTGLGLYVADKLARKLGTTIDIKSRLNYGSTFSISLPLKATSQKALTHQAKK